MSLSQHNWAAMGMLLPDPVCVSGTDTKGVIAFDPDVAEIWAWANDGGPGGTKHLQFAITSSPFTPAFLRLNIEDEEMTLQEVADAMAAHSNFNSATVVAGQSGSALAHEVIPFFGSGTARVHLEEEQVPGSEACGVPTATITHRRYSRIGSRIGNYM